MVQLRTLLLHDNSFGGNRLPNAFRSLSRLQVLDVTASGLQGALYSWFSSFPDLEVLLSSSTSMDSPRNSNGIYWLVDPSIDSCTKLRKLVVSTSVQGVVIPDEMASLTSLEVFDFYSSSGSSYAWPNGWDALVNLTSISVRIQRHISGGFDDESTLPFPSWLWTLPSLNTLQVLGSLNTTIPPAIGNLTKLTNLRFQSSVLYGTLPPEIGNLTNLETLFLGGSHLTGPIPDEIGQLTQLEYLLLRSNQFTSLPSTLGAMTSLIFIDVADNALVGPLPTGVGGLKKLATVYLNNNAISGFADASYAELTSLVVVSISGNRVQGLPDMSRWSQLQTLDVSFNPITTGFPTSILKSNSLQFVAMMGCGLTGTIPNDFFLNMTSLQNLYLYSNNISGLLPTSLLTLPAIQTLALHDNKLEGNLSLLDFSRLTTLSSLSLQQNRFTGPVPEWIFNMSRLSSIELSSNRLSGTIPDDFFLGRASTRRFRLALASNLLTGQLPSSLNGTGGALLSSLDLSYNQLKICANPNITVLDGFLACTFLNQNVPNYWDCGCEKVFSKCRTTPDPIGECIPCVDPPPSYESTGVDWMCYNGYWFYNGTADPMTTFSNLTLAATPIFVQGNLTVDAITFTNLKGFLNVSQCLRSSQVKIILNPTDSATLVNNGGVPPTPLINVQFDPAYAGKSPSRFCSASPITLEVTQNLRSCTLHSNTSQSDPRTLASSFSITSRKGCGDHKGLAWWAILLIVIACVIALAVTVGIIFTVHPKLRSIVRPFHNRARPTGKLGVGI